MAFSSQQEENEGCRVECEQARDSHGDFLAEELELVSVQVGGGGGRAPAKVTNVGAAGRRRAAATAALTLKSYGSCWCLCQQHLRRTSIMREEIFY